MSQYATKSITSELNVLTYSSGFNMLFNRNYENLIKTLSDSKNTLLLLQFL